MVKSETHKILYLEGICEKWAPNDLCTSEDIRQFIVITIFCSQVNRCTKKLWMVFELEVTWPISSGCSWSYLCLVKSICSTSCYWTWIANLLLLLLRLHFRKTEFHTYPYKTLKLYFPLSKIHNDIYIFSNN